MRDAKPEIEITGTAKMGGSSLGPDPVWVLKDREIEQTVMLAT